MERIDLRINDINDKDMYSQLYVPAYEVDILKKRNTIEIQRYVCECIYIYLRLYIYEYVCIFVYV
jgi:hypothetical protein